LFVGEIEIHGSLPQLRSCCLFAVIPGQCAASNPESRDSGFALRAPRNDGW
jgi:hypothetical protein